MALDAQLVSGATTYRLQAEQVEIVIGRPVLQIPLPSNVNPLLLDLGQFRPTIILSGRVNETAGETDGGVVIPSKNQLEDFVTDTWNQTITFTVSADAYTVKIASARFQLVSGIESIWNFSLQLVAQGRT